MYQTYLLSNGMTPQDRTRQITPLAETGENIVTKKKGRSSLRLIDTDTQNDIERDRRSLGHICQSLTEFYRSNS